MTAADLAPQQLSSSEQNAPDPVIDVETGRGEGRATELNDEYLHGPTDQQTDTSSARQSPSAIGHPRRMKPR